MQFSNLKDYLKALRIQKYYVNKFKINYANNNYLTKVSNLYLKFLDKEIKEIENSISLYKYNQSKIQVSIFDIIDKE